MAEIDLARYNTRLGTREDASKILGLINLVQPADSWTAEHLVWQFFQLGGGEPFLYLIFDQELLVALYVATNKRCLVDVEVENGFMIQDVMTHPEYRGQGFLNYLSSLCFREISKTNSYAYTFPNKLSENSFRRRGWSELAKVPLREAATNSIEAVNFELKIERIESFDRHVGAVWSNSDLAVGVERDQNFLNWRYSKPGENYYKFVIDENRGFLVLKLFENDESKTLHLLDLVVEKGSRHMMSSILQFVREFAVSQQAEKVTCWLGEKHPYSATFDSFGLNLLAEHDRYIFVLAPSERLSVFSDFEKWHLTQGDSDVY